MAKIERGGIRLTVENYEAFTRQLNAASSSMRGFGQQAQQTATEVNAAAGEYRGSSVVIEQWTETVDTSGEAAAALLQNLTALGLQLAAVGAAGTGAVVGLGLFASRVEEVGALLEVTRQNAVNLAIAEDKTTKAAEMNATAVQAQVQGIRDLHLSGLVATETVAALIRYNLDWTKATELARLAQDAATFAMQDSSQAVEGLIHGITTLQPRVLRSYGIMVNLTEAYRVYAEQNNLVATELTQAQRQQAAFNAVLAQAPSIAGAYEASMSTASKQLRSLNTDIQDFSEEFGEEFVPVLNVGVGAIRNLLHWLTELPDPLQGFLVGTTSAGSALALLGGTALLVVPRILGVVSALKQFAMWANISTSALLGVPGLIAGMVGLGVALAQMERARKDEAVQLLEVSDSYGSYIRNLESAGLKAYAFSEALFEVVKAKQAADAEFDVGRFAEARDEFINMTSSLQTQITAWANLRNEQGAFNEGIAQQTIDALRESISLLSDQALEVGLTESEVIKLAISFGLTADAASDLAIKIQELITAEKLLRGAQAPIGDHEEIMLGLVKRTVEYGDAVKRLDVSLAAINWSKSRKEIAEFVDLQEKAKEATEDIIKVFDQSVDKMVDAQLKRNRALEDLDIEYQQKAEDAWIEYQRALIEAEGDLAAFHAGTLQELLDLDRDYLRDRNDAWSKYQQNLADAERDLQRDIEDANRRRTQELQDLDREYAQDREDALRDLNDDLEDMAREHAQNLIDIETDRQQELLDLESEYQQRLYDIQNIAQQRLRDLQDKYAEKASDTRLKYLRQALEAVKNVLGEEFLAQFEGRIRALFLEGKLPTTQAEGFPLYDQIMALYEQLMADLEGQRDDLQWDEEDLSDDILREQQRRLEDLQQWLADEQAAIDAAYEERKRKEQERYADEQEERRLDYERKLEDLQLARERERQEIERDHQRRLDDLRRQHERERQEIALNYQRRLEDLQIEYERERQLIGEKLEEQNAEARQKYEEALEDIARAKEREREEINRQYDRTTEDVAADLDKLVAKAAEKYGLLPEQFRPTHDQLKKDLNNLLVADPDSLTNQWQSFLDNLRRKVLESGSPSRVMMRMGESVRQGLELGVGNLGDVLTNSFDMAAFQANIQAALPAQMAMLPAGIGANGNSSVVNHNLTVTAQYQHQSEASLRNDLALYNSMMRAWGR